VNVWLESAETDRSAADVIDASADLTKDALRIIAASAPAAIADNELVKSLTEMGYRATDLTRDRVLAGLDGLAAVTDGRLVKRVGETGAKAAYEMNSNVAKQLLKSILGG